MNIQPVNNEQSIDKNIEEQSIDKNIEEQSIDKSIELQIANLYLIWRTTEEISKSLNIPQQQVDYILSTKDVQDYLHKSASNQELQLHLKRLNKATELLDDIMFKIEEFINSDIPLSKWKDSQVNMIKDFLYNRLPDTISKAVWTAIQINIWNKWVTPEEDNFTKKINKLPKEFTLEFWDIVDYLLENPTLIPVIYNKLHDENW